MSCLLIILIISIVPIILTISNSSNNKAQSEARRKELNDENTEKFRVAGGFYNYLFDSPQPVSGDFCDKKSIGERKYSDGTYNAYLVCQYAGSANCVNCIRRATQIIDGKFKYGSSLGCKEEVYVDRD